MVTAVKVKTSGTTSKSRGPKVSANLRKFLEVAVRDDLLITPYLDQFLVSWDGNYSERVWKRIAEVLATPQRDRSGSWSASSAGKCYRRQEFSFLGMPQVGSVDPRLQSIFLNGRWVHLKWQATLMEAGLLDNIEVTHKKPSTRSQCSMDGMGTGTDGRYAGREFGFELKGRNDWAFNGQTIKGVDEQTRKQVDFEFMLSGLDMFVVLNENKNNQSMKEWVFFRDEDRIGEMRKQVKQLNKSIDIQRLHPQLPECKKQLKDGEFFKCPYGTPGGVCASAGTWPRGI